MAEVKTTTTAATSAASKEETVSESTTVKKAKAAPKKAVKKAEASTSDKTTAKKAVKKTTDESDKKSVEAKADDGVKASEPKDVPKSTSTESKASKSTAALSKAAAKPAEEKAEVKEESKPAKKAAPAKKAEAKEEAKPVKKAAAKKTPAKKAAPAKKAEVKEEVKPVEKTPVAEEAKAASKEGKEPAQETKPAAKKVEKPAKPAAKEAKAPVKEKAPAKKAEVKEEVKAEPKPEVKEEVKPVEIVEEETETISPEEKTKIYNDFSLDTLIDMAKALGIEKGYDDYKNILLDETDMDKIVADLATEAVNADDFDYEEDGYDIDILPILIVKVGDTMEIKASDFNDLSKRINAALKLELNDDALHNTDVYNELFDTVRQVLMIAQRRDITSLDEIDRYLKTDVQALVTKFMDVAYAVLVNWQYKDVRYYEGFIYSVLSQFDALHQNLGNRAMMDVADLLILHGDYGLGDANYRYIIRENDLKDMIYFRFANVYKNIDRDKARAIANEALQWVDGRFDYYPAIIEILQN